MEKAEIFLSKDSFPELGSDQAPPSIDFRSTPHPWVDSAIALDSKIVPLFHFSGWFSDDFGNDTSKRLMYV